MDLIEHNVIDIPAEQAPATAPEAAVEEQKYEDAELVQTEQSAEIA